MNAPDSCHSDDYEVTECECGHLTLRFGRLRIELTRQEFARLRQELAEAAVRFNVPQFHTATSRRSVRH